MSRVGGARGALRRWSRALLGLPLAMAAVLPAAQSAAAATSVSAASFQSTGSDAYQVDFTTSASGGLSGPSGAIALGFSGLTVTAATYTVNAGGTPVVVTGQLTGSTLQLTLASGQTIAASTAVVISLANLTNPTAPTTVGISTSSDQGLVLAVLGGGSSPGPGPGSGPGPGGSSVSSVTVSPAPDTAGATSVYTVTFTVYSALPAGGTVSFQALGTVFPSQAADYVITDLTTGSGSGTVVAAPTVSSGLTTFAVPNGLNAGDHISVAVSAVTNPQQASTSQVLSVSTSADTAPVNSPDYTIAPGQASQLAFSGSLGGTAGLVWPSGDQPNVVEEDAYGNQTGAGSATVTLAIYANPSHGSLTCSGGLSMAAVSGDAAFSGCSIDQAGLTYQLSASATGLAPATSPPFTVSPLVASGAIYAMGGSAAGGVSYAMSVDVLAANGWSQVPVLPIARTQLAAAADPANGMIYALGGENGAGTVLDTAEADNPLNNAWKTVMAMPTARAGLAAVYDSANGLVYAIGGQDSGGTALSTVESYNPATNAWQSEMAMPTARSGLAAVYDPSTGLVYAIGGQGASGALATVEAYNPATNAWQSETAMPTARADLAAVYDPSTGLVYAIGGQGASGALATVEAYNPATNAWQSETAMPEASSGLAAVMGGDGEIYALGGQNGSSSELATVVAFQPAQGSWTAKAALPTALVGLAAVPVSTVSGLTVTPSSATVSASTQYTVSFTATSGLTVSQAVYLLAPTGTVFPSTPSAYTVNGVSATAVTTSYGDYSQITVPTGVSVGDDGQVTVVIAGVTNPASTGGVSMNVMTSADQSPVASPPYVITAGAASQLTFSTQPGDGTGGSALSVQPQVTVEDGAGNPVSSTATVTLAITSPGGATLTCVSNAVAAVGGIASFSGCAINKAASGYTLTASASGLTSAQSAGFNVTVGPAAQLDFTVQPGGGSAVAAWPTQPVVTVEDAGGNTVAASSASVSLAISANPGSGALSCSTNPLAATAGVASFAGCAISQPGSAYTLLASASGLTGATSASFDIGAEAALTISTATTLPQAASNTPYSEQLAASGGSGSYSWALTSGSLPQGLSLSLGGLISGTPVLTDAGDTVGLSIQATDTATSQTATWTGQLSVVGTAVQAPTLQLSSAVQGEAGVTYTLTFTTSSVGAITSTNPYGMTITLTAPLGTGLPTQAADYAVSDPSGSLQVQSVYQSGGSSITITLAGSGTVIPDSTAVTVTISGVANPPVTATADQLAVSTSADLSQASTPDYAITALSLPSALAGSTLTVTPSPIVFNQSSGQSPSTTAVVFLADGAGTPISGKTVTVSVYTPQSMYGWQVSPASATSGANGDASFTVSLPGGYGQAGTILIGAVDATDGVFIGGAAVQVYTYGLSFSGGEYSGVSETVSGSGLPASTAVTAASFGGSPLTLSQPCSTDAYGNLSCTFTVPQATVGQTYTVALTIGGVVFAQGLQVAQNPAGVPATITVSSGNNQSTTVGTAVANQLTATVDDSLGNPVGGASVTFTVHPSLGAGATFAGGATSATVNTDGSGLAVAPALTATDTAGSFTVTALLTGYSTFTTFDLTNLAGAASTLTVSGGDGQVQLSGRWFSQDLKVTLSDAFGNPVSGQTVTFTAPGSGASATFANGVSTATTLQDGTAEVQVMAGSQTGPYQVTAQAQGVSGTLSLDLTNATTLIQTCDDPTLQSAFAAGGYIAFACSGTIQLSQTLTVPAGLTVTLDAGGQAVNLEGPPTPVFGSIQAAEATGWIERVFDVEGGQLTLVGINVSGGQVQAPAGSAGADGAAGAPGQNGAGTDGQDGAPGLDGSSGAAAMGGAMYIAAGSQVLIEGGAFSGNLAMGGVGGDGGAGGAGGIGGGGGGATESPTSAGSGGAGGVGGSGGSGGTAQGGAIYNLGSLTLKNVDFVGNRAVGGGGGMGNVGGQGGQGGLGVSGQTGPKGGSDVCINASAGGEGYPGGSGGAGGQGGASGVGGAGGAAMGGAIYSLGTLQITGGDFAGNQAEGSTGGYEQSAGINFGGIGGVGGNGGNGGQGGDVTVPATGCPHGTGSPGKGGDGGTGGASGNSAPGGVGGAGGDGGMAQGGAIWDGGSLSVDGTVFGDSQDGGNLASGGPGADGGPGGSAADGVQGSPGGGGPGGLTCGYTEAGLSQPVYGCTVPAGADGKGGVKPLKSLGAAGGLGGDGGNGGGAQGGAIYETAGASVQVSSLTFGGQSAYNGAANLASGGTGGAGGLGGYSKCGLTASQNGVEGFACTTMYGSAKRTYSGTDGLAGSGSGAQSFTAGQQNSQLEITTTSLPGGVAGGYYAAVVQATDGVAPYQWSATGLPQGFSLDPTYGIISATGQTTPGVYFFTVTVTDSSPTPETASETLSIALVAATAQTEGVDQVVSGSSNASDQSPDQSVTAGGAGTATPDTVAQVSGGTGSVAVTDYTTDPGVAASFNAAGQYFDVAVSTPATGGFQTVVISQCNVAAGTVLEWLNGGTWQAVAPAASYDAATGCLSFTATPTTAPDIAQLTGTVFAVAIAPPRPAGGGAVAVAPVLTALQPASGPAAGGTTVTISGLHLTDARSVAFGTTPASSFTVVSDSEITALSPPGSGTVEVTVTTPAGTSPASAGDQFTYQAAVAAGPSFSDVTSGYWAYGAIETLAGKGVVSGFQDGSFRPAQAVTRAEFVKMLDLVLGLTPHSGQVPFSDVSASAWFDPYVAAALGAGIVQGTSATAFSPNAVLTRAQMAVMVARALKLATTATLSFTDVAQISPWARAGVEEAVAAGYVTGFPDGSFQPLALATRAQAAQLLALVLSHRPTTAGASSAPSVRAAMASGPQSTSKLK